jgi:hypothetical protein
MGEGEALEAFGKESVAGLIQSGSGFVEACDLLKEISPFPAA